MEAMSTATTTTSWRKEVRENDMTKTLRVEKVENGFIITISKYGHTGEGDDKKYIDENKQFISEANPFEQDFEKEDDTTAAEKKPCCAGTKALVLSAMQSIGDMDGLISTL